MISEKGFWFVKVISYILMMLFSVMLITLIPVATVLFSANSTILKPYNTEKYIAESGLNANFKQVIRKQFTGEEENQKQTALRMLQGKLVGQAFDMLVTDELFANKLGLLQTSFWDYMTDKTKTFLHVPIAELSDINAKFPALKIGELGDLNTLIGLKADKLEDIKRYYSFYSKGLLGLYILIFILASVCVLLTFVLDISGKWLGIVLTSSGVLALLLWVPFRLLSTKINFSQDMKPYEDGIGQLIINARHDFLQCLTIVSVVVIAIGILTMFMRKREQAPDTPQENSDIITI